MFRPSLRGIGLLREARDVSGINGPPDRIDKKGDWYSTSRLFIKLYLVLSGDLNHYSDQDQWFPRYIE
jgi:hypothetical protein